MKKTIETFSLICLSIVIGLIFFSIPGYAIDITKPIRTGTCFNIPQVEYGSSYQNITSIIQPNGYRDNLGVYMTKNGNDYTYSYCNTTQPGYYLINGCSDVSCWSFQMQSNYGGFEYTDTQAIIYAVLFVVLICVFILSIYWFNKLEWRDDRNEDGEIIKINWKKYLKIGSFMLGYLCLIFIFYLSWNISLGILQFSEMANVFKFMFYIIFSAMFPLFLFLIGYGLIKLITDKGLQDKIQRGLTIE